MQRRVLIVLCGAVVGTCLGLALYRLQPPSWTSMNLLGILAFASLGTSCGCLLADPTDRQWM